MGKIIFIASAFMLAGCVGEASGSAGSLWEEAAGVPWDFHGKPIIHTRCIGSDKVFAMTGSHGGGLSVIQNHKDCHE